MRVGILNALTLDDGAVDWGGTPVDVYVRFLQSAGADLSYVGYELTRGEFPATPGECDAYLITGSPAGAYDDEPWIARLIQLIRDCYADGRKMVGICFGHQVLAHALGGRAEKSARGWGLGVGSIAIEGARPWMADAPASCDLYFVHQDQVVQLPPGAERLGGSDFCPNALFTLGDRVLGLQGHPEFSADMMRQILPTLERRVEPARYAAALGSLGGGAPHSALMARWVVAFLTAG